MRRSRELGKSTLPQPPHRTYPSHLAWGLPLRGVLSTVTKNAGPKKIFPIFPQMAAILAKWSAIGNGYSLRDNSRITAAYLMKRTPCGME